MFLSSSASSSQVTSPSALVRKDPHSTIIRIIIDSSASVDGVRIPTTATAELVIRFGIYGVGSIGIHFNYWCYYSKDMGHSVKPNAISAQTLISVEIGTTMCESVFNMVKPRQVTHRPYHTSAVI